MQLHAINKDDEDDEEDEDDIRHQNDDIPKHLTPEEDPINSDFKRNILDKSVEHEQPLPEHAPASPNLKEHLLRNNFFSSNFDQGTPQSVVN